MKICVISNDYSQMWPILNCGGAEDCQENLAEGLKKNGYDFYVICPKRDVTKNYDFPIFESTFYGNEKSKIKDAYAADAVRIARRNKSDLILSSFYSDSFRYITDIPIIITVHGAGDGAINAPTDQKNVYYQFISDVQEERCLKSHPEYKNRSFLAYTSLSNDHFFTLPSQDYFLFCSSLCWGVESKGIDVFVNLAAKYPQYKFKIYGAGNKNIENWLSGVQNKLSNFEYGGFLDRYVNHKQVFAQAKAFCQFSRLQESFGRVTPQALSKGVPVIGFGNGATAKFIENGKNGYLVSNEQELDFALKNVDFLNRYDIMNNAKEKFGVDKEIGKIMEFCKCL